MKRNKIFRILAVTAVLSMMLVVSATPALAVSARLSPTTGEIGDEIDITGSGYDPGDKVYIYFSSQEADTRDDIEDDLDVWEEVETTHAGDTDETDEGDIDTSFDVPDELTDGPDEEEVHGGEYFVYTTDTKEGEILTVDTFTVTGITISPTEGPVGSRVSISGVGFDDKKDISYIKYDGTTVSIASGDDETDRDGEFTSTIVIPNSTAGDHTITVRDASRNEAEAEFTVWSEIAINPASGLAGDTVTVSGTGFSGSSNITIYFNNVAMAVTSGTARTNSYGTFENVKFSVPGVGAGTYEVQAKDGANKTDTATFSMAATATFSPTTGYVGTEVTVSGTGFRASQSITVTFADAAVGTTLSDDRGSFTTSFNVPARAAGTYRIRVTDGTNTKETNFAISTSASISPVTSSASPGHVGTELTVSGIGFIAGKTVTIKYDATEVTTTTVNADGTFSAKFEVPASKSGEHNITATDGTVTQQFTFTMESEAPPIPELLEPETDTKAKAEVFFDWEDVTDDSLPITYDLQVASDERFTSIVLEQEGLTDSEYTVTKEEKLESVSEEEPYYWSVKAIDGASNESVWAKADSFYVGFAFGMPGLPTWGIYALFGVGALLLGFLGFWLGRRTAYSSY